VTESGQPQFNASLVRVRRPGVSDPCPQGRRKTRNIASITAFPCHLDGDGRDSGNVIFEGIARIDPAGPSADTVTAFVEKYRSFIESYGWTPESLTGDYPDVIPVAATGVRIW